LRDIDIERDVEFDVDRGICKVMVLVRQIPVRER
jgi:hypothetical protein